MEEVVPGAFGTCGSLLLRLGQAVFGITSLLSMCLGVEFFSYLAFRFLVTIMSMVIPWSLTLAVVDMFIISIKFAARPPGILSIVVLGDWVLALLSLAAYCSTTSVMKGILASEESPCMENMCLKYEVATATAFVSWYLLMVSLLFNYWLLPSVRPVYVSGSWH